MRPPLREPRSQSGHGEIQKHMRFERRQPLGVLRARMLDAARGEARHPPGRASQPIQSTDRSMQAMSGERPGDMS
jgi:hypothetical protein